MSSSSPPVILPAGSDTAADPLTGRSGLLPVAVYELDARDAGGGGGGGGDNGDEAGVIVGVTRSPGALWALLEDAAYANLSPLPLSLWAPPLDTAASSDPAGAGDDAAPPVYVLPPLQFQFHAASQADFSFLGADEHGSSAEMGFGAHPQTLLDSDRRMSTTATDALRSAAFAVRSTLRVGKRRAAGAAPRVFGGAVPPRDWHRLPLLHLLLIAAETSDALRIATPAAKQWAAARVAACHEYLIVYIPLGTRGSRFGKLRSQLAATFSGLTGGEFAAGGTSGTSLTNGAYARIADRLFIELARGGAGASRSVTGSGRGGGEGEKGEGGSTVGSGVDSNGGGVRVTAVSSVWTTPKCGAAAQLGARWAADCGDVRRRVKLAEAGAWRDVHRRLTETRVRSHLRQQKAT